ncbi:MAG: FkbM family methyltransferase [Verrucomicrobiota bacterium]|nr:FkbM family methyltransferase [Verrucomicrobiota bacterium]
MTTGDPHTPYHSQYGQDEYLDTEVFLGLENGFFLDIGAHDGVTFSNTLFFEERRGWKGICVEPNRQCYELLTQNRRCACVLGCVSNHAGKAKFWEVSGPSSSLSGIPGKLHLRHRERIHAETGERGGKIEEIEITCLPLEALLRQYAIARVHYCSIDTEGGELDILNTIDFSTRRIDIFTVENNYGDTRIRRFLEQRGYRLLRADCDEVYRRVDPFEISWKERLAPQAVRLYRRLLRRLHRGWAGPTAQ